MPPLLRALRPAQWPKNLLLLAGVVFGGRLAEGAAIGRAAAAVAAFSALSSAVYLANDLADAAEDRRHPRKRARPVASGAVSATAAAATAAVLAAAGLAASAALGRPFLAAAVFYLALQALYVGWGRAVAVLDVVLVAVGFVLRAVAGAVAVDVPYSPWLVVTSFIAALLLILGKRRAEATSAGGVRPSLAAFPVAALDAAIAAASGALLLAYALYTILSPTAVRGGAAPTPHLVWTFPFVAFGVMRYLQIVMGGVSGRSGEEPEEILLQDRPTQCAVAGWIALVVALLYGGF